MTVPIFTSALAPAMSSFAQHRQALGYEDKVNLYRLAHFDRFLVARGWTCCYLTRDIVEDWVASGPPIRPNTRLARLHVMRVLGRFISQTQPETYVPGPAWGSRPSSVFRAHIYTSAEIGAILAAAHHLTPVGSLRPFTYVTLFGLLYCTGLRISEALALHLGDVDFDAGTLFIRESKFHKSRFIPLNTSTTDALRHYQEERTKRGCPRDPDAPFFVNERRTTCAYPAVCALFLLLARRVAVRGPAGTRGPRIHDLRHTCVVHRLLEWYRDGGDVQARLPLLSDYLGHVSLASTQVYLNMTAELLQEAAHRFLPPTQSDCLQKGDTL